MIGLDFCQWRNSLIITPRMRVLATHLLSSTVVITPASPLKKTPTLLPGQDSRRLGQWAKRPNDDLSEEPPPCPRTSEASSQQRREASELRPGWKVWLNSKYIKTKRNRRLESKFFGPFRVLHPIGSQAYKLELPKRWRIHEIFHVSLLEQDTIRKGRVTDIKTQLEFDAGNNGDEVEAIRDSMVFAKKSEAGQSPGLYYLISWKEYPEEDNIWEPSSAVQHLRKLLSTFHNYPDKTTATSLPIDTAPPMARPTVSPSQPVAKRKHGRPGKKISKRAKKSWDCFNGGSLFYHVFLSYTPVSIPDIALDNRGKQPATAAASRFFFLHSLTVR